MPTFLDFVGASDSVLAKADILEMNAACAVGLPGAESFGYPKAREVVDYLAGAVKVYTRSHYALFESRPAEFGNSKAVFRVLSMVTVLQRDEGITYCPGLMNQPNSFRDARNVFAHGALMGRGTCSSLPIVFVAVGRRLGYPLKLVSAKSHLFARWDDPTGERFNIECTAQGFVSHPDRHYLFWPIAIHPEELRACGWLRSKTPREELSFCLDSRGHCLLENLHFYEAAGAFAYSGEMDLPNRIHNTCVEATLNRWERHLGYWRAEPFPEVQVAPIDRNGFPNLPLHLAERMNYLRRLDEAINAEQQERLLEEQAEEGRRKAEQAEWANIEFHYSDSPEQVHEAEERMPLAQATREVGEKRKK